MASSELVVAAFWRRYQLSTRAASGEATTPPDRAQAAANSLITASVSTQVEYRQASSTSSPEPSVIAAMGRGELGRLGPPPPPARLTDGSGGNILDEPDMLW